MKGRNMNSSYGFIGEHKVKPQGSCWNCGNYNGDEKQLKFIVNDDIERADCVCPECNVLMGILYSRLDEFVKRIRLMRPSRVAAAIIKDQRIRGVI